MNISCAVLDIKERIILSFNVLATKKRMTSSCNVLDTKEKITIRYTVLGTKKRTISYNVPNTKESVLF